MGARTSPLDGVDHPGPVENGVEEEPVMAAIAAVAAVAIAVAAVAAIAAVAAGAIAVAAAGANNSPRFKTAL